MKSPNYILKRVPLRNIFYMRKVSHVKTLNENVIAQLIIEKYRYFKMNSHSQMNSYFK